VRTFRGEVLADGQDLSAYHHPLQVDAVLLSSIPKASDAVNYPDLVAQKVYDQYHLAG
jgi:hypothetical protein